MKSIALLVCGSLTGAVYAAHGDYHRVFTQFLTQTHDQLTLDPYDVVSNMEYPPEDRIDDYDAILLTGSAASAYENVEWINKLIDYVKLIALSKPHIKIIGICFGHQIIGRAFGSQCVPNGGKWEVGPTPLTLTPLGKRLFSGLDSFNIQEMHRDHVPVVPPSFHLLASTAISNNQGMVRFNNTTDDPHGYSLADVHILTLQGHPEFTEPIVSALVEQRHASGVIDAEAAADAERRRFWKNDGVGVCGKAIWSVLGPTVAN